MGKGPGNRRRAASATIPLPDTPPRPPPPTRLRRPTGVSLAGQPPARSCLATLRAPAKTRSIHTISIPAYTENSRRIKRGYVPAALLADLGRWLLARSPARSGHALYPARPAHLCGPCFLLERVFVCKRVLYAYTFVMNYHFFCEK